MTIPDKFYLKWNDFQQNVTNSFKEMREDFCDVTLVGEGNTKIQAHKLILSTSSNFFLNFFRQNPNPKPLLYMRGIKDDQLSAVVDFMYNGETRLAQDDLDDFLQLAEELKLKGLARVDASNDKNEVSNCNTNSRDMLKLQKNVNTPVNESFVPKTEQHINEAIDQQLVDNAFDDIVENMDLEAIDTKTTKYDNINEVNLTIRSMIQKDEGIWRCTQCEKTNKDRRTLRKHIEAKHIDGVSRPCNRCGKALKSRNALYNHKAVYHKQ